MKLMKLFFSVTAIFLLFGTSGAAMAQLEFTGCLKDNGKLRRVAPGDDPTKECKKKQTEIQFPSTAISAAVLSLIGEDLEERPPIGGGTPPNPACDARVGGDGPGGGFIFFVTDDRCKGLEVSKIDLPSTKWGCFATRVGAYYERLGNGYENTSLIIGAGCTDGDDAADLAIAYVWPNGQTDGYLPDFNELWKIYNTIGPGGAGFPFGELYWMSTEEDDDVGRAFVLDFSTGIVAALAKRTDAFGRAVRIFDLESP